MVTNGTHQESLIRKTVKRLQQISNDELSSELRDKATLAILDYFGAVASGLQAPWAPALVKYASVRSGMNEAHVWGLQKDVSVETAAFVNAALAHTAIVCTLIVSMIGAYANEDDMHLKSNSHIGGIVISAAFALAQRDGWSGEQLLKAIVGGYEASSLLGVAVQQSPGYNRHVRPSGHCGAFGAAAAAIVARNLDENVAVNALAFAANMSSGYNEWAWAGGQEIYTEMGTASQAGIIAVGLARSGMECSETLLEGRAGLFAAVSASEGVALYNKTLAAPIGKGILDVNFKPVPGCNYAQTPLAVALRIAQKHKPAGNIKAVRVGCTTGAKNYPGCDNPGPFETIQQTKMSIQFGVCAVLTNAKVSEEIFKQFDSKEITKLASECIVEALPEYLEPFKEGRQPAKIQVTLSDGSTLEEELSDVPWLDAEAVANRLQDEMSTIMGSPNARNELVEAVRNLKGSKDCSDLFASFRKASAV